MDPPRERENEREMDFNSMSENDQFQMATRECQIQLPPPPYYEMWRDFFLALYAQVIHSEENEKLRYRVKVWDFCVIHSNHPEDHETANQFVRLLETSLGISGKTLGSVALGENTLDAASMMVQGSSKAFVLVSRYLESARVPKFVFQAALMQQLQRPDWRCKIVPMYVQGSNVTTPFYLSCIQGIKLGRDPSGTVELVSRTITLEEQMQVRAIRDRNQMIFRSRLRRQRRQRILEIRDVIAGLREDQGDEYDPTQQLEQTINQIESITANAAEGAGGAGGQQQLVKISACQGVTLGPSFHFHGTQRGDAPSNGSVSSRSSIVQSPSGSIDSPIYFQP